jgi:uncharacterized cofD-like protein
MSEPPRVVSIGGGNGLSALLAGLKLHPANITAIVTVTDDGGSSGRLRREFDVLPPGDIRNCMVALSEDEALLSRLFQFRFEAGRGLRGHSFGNLFLTAMTAVLGDFSEAVRKSSEVLNIGGRIFPSTASDVSLEAVLSDGRVVRGESRISRSKKPIREVRIVPARVRPLKETLAAIERADLITFGPGSLFTSVIPNLLVTGIPNAIRRSRALKAYFVNLMSQPGETTDFRASDHIAAISRHSGGDLIECAVVSNSKVPPAMRRRYAAQNATPVENDIDALRALGIDVVEADLLMKAAKVRHNPAAVGAVAFALARRGQTRKLNAER